MTTAFDRAIAQMEAASAERTALLARVEADKRYAALSEYVAIFAPTMPGYGVAGFADIVRDCTSSRYWRTKRAEALSLARKHQVMGNRAVAKIWLGKAAVHRLTEKAYRNAERRAEYVSLFATAVGAPALVAAE